MSRKRIQIFVGGVSPQVNQSMFETFFKSFGPMTECRLVVDKLTRRLGLADQSRGFGFVSFVHHSDAEKVLNRKLKICGKEVGRAHQIECKDALTKGDSNAKVNEEKIKKIFVGGLPHDITQGSRR